MATGADVDSLGRSRLGQLANNRLKQLGLDENKIEQALSSGGMSGLASAVGGRNAGMVEALGIAGSKIPELASLLGGTAQLASLAPISSSRGGASDSGASNPFGSLLHQGDSAAAPAPEGEVAFEGAERKPASTDIWHEGDDRNLFQIVSGKYEEVGTRLTK
jgi:hypothetical protein